MFFLAKRIKNLQPSRSFGMKEFNWQTEPREVEDIIVGVEIMLNH